MQFDAESEPSAGSYDFEADWQRILDLVPAGAYTCDAEGLITYFSPSAETAWGRTPTLRSPVDRYCGSYKLYWANGTPMRHDECWMARALGEGIEFNRQEVQIERPDGSRIFALAYANPVRNQHGKIVGALNLIFGVEVQQQSEADQGTTQLIPTLSHDAALAMVEIVLGISALAAMSNRFSMLSHH